MRRDPVDEWSNVALGQDDGETADYTDLYNANAFVAKYGDAILYCKGLGGWFHYDGSRYVREGRGEVERDAKLLVRWMYREAKREVATAVKELKSFDKAHPGTEKDEKKTTSSRVKPKRTNTSPSPEPVGAEGTASKGETSAEEEALNERKQIVARLAEARSKLGWARKSQNRDRLVALLAVAASEQGVAVLPSELDADPFLLNVANGTLDLRTGTLRDHSADDRITKLSPVVYDAAATCPKWEAFLAEVLPDPEVRRFLRSFVGYALTGVIRERVLVFLIGAGANGKSVFLRVVRSVLGDYAGTMAPELLLAKRGESHPTEVADLCGVRLAVCSEVRIGRAFDECRIKSLTGNDMVKARKMRADFVEFPPTWKLAIGANHRPAVRDLTDSIWDRLRMVPFPVRVPKEKRNAKLVEELLEEAPGILRWAVEGCMLWQRQGLQEPPAVIEATEDYRTDEDWLRRFLGDSCLLDPASRTLAKDIYAAYRGWAAANGEELHTQKVLGASLKGSGLRSTKSNGKKCWIGIGLTEDGEKLRAEAETMGTMGTDRPKGRQVSTPGDGGRQSETPSPSSPHSPSDVDEEVFAVPKGGWDS